MYEVNEKEILIQEIVGSLFEAYGIFESNYKSIDLSVYLEFFWQIYYSLRNINFEVEEISVQHIYMFDRFDPMVFNILFYKLQNAVKKYGIRMDRVPSLDTICIHFDKTINKRIYYVDSINDLEKVRRSIAA